MNRKYQSPEITTIMLDNEISLILLSDAPIGPDEQVFNASPESFSPNHFA